MRRDAPVADDRRASSPAMLVARVNAVGDAWREQDEDALREELRALSVEAALLAATTPLFRNGIRDRQRIAASASMGRIG